MGGLYCDASPHVDRAGRGSINGLVAKGYVGGAGVQEHTTSWARSHHGKVSPAWKFVYLHTARHLLGASLDRFDRGALGPSARSMAPVTIRFALRMATAAETKDSAVLEGIA